MIVTQPTGTRVRFVKYGHFHGLKSVIDAAELAIDSPREEFGACYSDFNRKWQGSVPIQGLTEQGQYDQGSPTMIRALLRDERGFIVSSELVLIATILVLGLIVGLSSIQHAVVAEMNDVGDAIGHLNQSYWYSGFSAVKGSGYGNYAGGGWGNWGGGAAKAYTRGSAFRDVMDDCDNDQCDLACDLPVNEGRGWYYGYGGNYCDNY